jgi:hypothetical protein
MPRRELYGGFPIEHFYRTDGAERIRNKRFKVGVYRYVVVLFGVIDFLQNCIHCEECDRCARRNGSFAGGVD